MESARLQPYLRAENFSRTRSATFDADITTRSKLIDEHRILILSAQGVRAVLPESSSYLIRIHGALSEFDELDYADKYEKVFEFRMEDWNAPETIEDEVAIDIVAAFKEIPAEHKLVVFHCRMGQSRSAAVACAFARYKKDLAAEALIRQSGFHDPNSFVFERLLKFLPDGLACSA